MKPLKPVSLNRVCRAAGAVLAVGSCCNGEGLIQTFGAAAQGWFVSAGLFPRSPEPLRAVPGPRRSPLGGSRAPLSGTERRPRPLPSPARL